MLTCLLQYKTIKFTFNSYGSKYWMSLINTRMPIPYMKLIDNRVSVLNTKYL